MSVNLFRIKVPKQEILELLKITEQAKCTINIGYDHILASGKSIEGLLSLDDNREWLFIMHDITTSEDYEIGEMVKEKWGTRSENINP